MRGSWTNVLTSKDIPRALDSCDRSDSLAVEPELGREHPPLPSGEQGAGDHDRPSNSGSIVAVKKLLSCTQCVAAVDVDCFYAQAEELRHPDVKGKPVGIRQKMLCITANYEARKYGIKKGDHIEVAKKKCPHLVVFSGEDLTWYEEVSSRIFHFWSQFTPHVERLGLDEVFVDLTSIVETRIQQSTAQTEGVAGMSLEAWDQRNIAANMEHPRPHKDMESAQKLLDVGHQLDHGHCPNNVFAGWVYAGAEDQDLQDPDCNSLPSYFFESPTSEIPKDEICEWDNEDSFWQPESTSSLAASCIQRMAVASQVCAELREQLQRDVGITTSAGISVSKLLAKMVANEHKPAQQTTLVPVPLAMQRRLPYSTPVQHIPGIGFAATRKLNDAGLSTIGEVAQILPLEEFQGHLADNLPTSSQNVYWEPIHGNHFHSFSSETRTPLRQAVNKLFDPKALKTLSLLCHGLDPTSVTRSAEVAKTISVEDSFWANPITNQNQLKEALLTLVKSLIGKLRKGEARAGQQRQPQTFRLTIRQKSTSDDNPTKRMSKQAKIDWMVLGTHSLGISSTHRQHSADASDSNSSLDEDQLKAKALVTIAAGLFLQIVPANEPFQLHIVNVAFGNFIDKGGPSTKSGIRKFMQPQPNDDKDEGRVPAPLRFGFDDIDPEIFDALPEEIKAEVRATYQTSKNYKPQSSSDEKALPNAKRQRTISNSKGSGQKNLMAMWKTEK